MLLIAPENGVTSGEGCGLEAVDWVVNVVITAIAEGKIVVSSSWVKMLCKMGKEVLAWIVVSGHECLSIITAMMIEPSASVVPTNTMFVIIVSEPPAPGETLLSIARPELMPAAILYSRSRHSMFGWPIDLLVQSRSMKRNRSREAQ